MTIEYCDHYLIIRRCSKKIKIYKDIHKDIPNECMFNK